MIIYVYILMLLCGIFIACKFVVKFMRAKSNGQISNAKAYTITLLTLIAIFIVLMTMMHFGISGWRYLLIAACACSGLLLLIRRLLAGRPVAVRNSLLARLAAVEVLFVVLSPFALSVVESALIKPAVAYDACELAADEEADPDYGLDDGFTGADARKDDYAVSESDDANTVPASAMWAGESHFFYGSGPKFYHVVCFKKDGNKRIRISSDPTGKIRAFNLKGDEDGYLKFRGFGLVSKVVTRDVPNCLGGTSRISMPVMNVIDDTDDYVYISSDFKTLRDKGQTYQSISKEAFWEAWLDHFGAYTYSPSSTASGTSANSSSDIDYSESNSDYSVKKCKVCGGLKKCGKCGGTGIVNSMGDIQDCPTCRRSGDCYNCGGTGIQL